MNTAGREQCRGQQTRSANVTNVSAHLLELKTEHAK